MKPRRSVVEDLRLDRRAAVDALRAPLGQMVSDELRAPTLLATGYEHAETAMHRLDRESPSRQLSEQPAEKSARLLGALLASVAALHAPCTVLIARTRLLATAGAWDVRDSPPCSPICHCRSPPFSPVISKISPRATRR